MMFCERGLVRKQIVLLEHDADLAPQRELVEVRIVDLDAVDLDRALRRSAPAR